MSELTVFYCASGRSFCWEACLSAKSIKQHMPNSIVRLYSDQKVSCRYIDACLRIPADTSIEDETRRTKIKKIDGIIRALHDLNGPSVFLDTDTFVTTSLMPMLDAIEGYDIAVAHDTWRNFRLYQWSTPFNSGVIFFRKSQPVLDFLATWRAAYAASSERPDQVSFHSTLLRSGLRIHVMPPEMNARCEEPIQLSGSVKIVHKHYFKSTMRHPAVVASLINSETGNRTIVLNHRKMYVVRPDFSVDQINLEETEELRKLALDFDQLDWEIRDWPQESEIASAV